jgi:hypothetical protein
MNPARSGLTTAAKGGIVAILAILVVGAAYLALPSLSTGSVTHSTSSSVSSAGSQPLGVLSLIGYFSHMQIQLTTYDNSEGVGVVDQQQNIAYVVLGKATLNSTQYTKVEFTQTGIGNNVIVWFNPQERIDRVDVLGVKNYTGAGAAVYASIPMGAMSFVTSFSNNATLFSLLSKTTESTMTIGSTQMVVTTYVIAQPAFPLTKFTIKFGTIPGTDTKIAVYLDTETSDLMESVVEVTSLTK